MKKSVSAPLAPRKNLKGTAILFWAIVVGIFIFMLIAIIMGQTRGPLMPALNSNYSSLVIMTAIISVLALWFARRLFAREIQTAKSSAKGLNEKLNMHRQALLKYLIICEMPVMLSIILYLLTANLVFQVYAAVFIGFMLTVMPSKTKVIELLELNGMEQKELE